MSAAQNKHLETNTHEKIPVQVAGCCQLFFKIFKKLLKEILSFSYFAYLLKIDILLELQINLNVA